MRILGVSPLHDSTVAIINDGVVEIFYKEERFTRIKRDSHAFKSIFLALQNKVGPIDHVCIGAPSHTGIEVSYLSTMLRKVLDCPVTDYSKHHHLSHASLAFYNSGFTNALVFVIDRDGAIIEDCMREAETVFLAEYPCDFKTLHKNFWIFKDISKVEKKLKTLNYSFNINSDMSVTKIYETATTLIGQKPLENGKTMGLAAYGTPKDFVNFFKNGCPRDELFKHDEYILEGFNTPIFKDYEDRRISEVTEDNFQFYADYAWQVQQQTQKTVMDMINEWVSKTGINRVCLTGGYALNVVTNEYLVKNLPNIEFYFEPLADDSGNSLGAALHLHHSITQDRTIRKLEHTFIHGIENVQPLPGEPCSIETIAHLLANQKTVAVFNKLAESGPRALGNRSILFDPRNPQAKNIVNKIKNREWYRPFAAMILEEYFQDYFETHGLISAELMTISFQCKKPIEIPGVVHVDNSCRIQTVSNNIPHIFELLTEFNKQTNCPVLLNTSFNLAGEPLVETLDDALKTFWTSNIDILWFPETNTYITKQLIR